MNREIKFRGKSSIRGLWVFGDSIKHTDNDTVTGIEDVTYIGSKVKDARRAGAMKWVPVAPDTLCQYTGLKDRTGQRIYEGDILFWISKDSSGRGRGEQGCIFWDNNTMAWAIVKDTLTKDGRKSIVPRPFEKRHLEVVGNIFDNPVLMNGIEVEL